MVSDMLSSVLEKEKAVAELEAQAKAKADKIITDAEAKAKDILEQSKSAIRNSETEKLSEARAEAEKAVDYEVRKAQAYSTHMKASCEEKLEESIKEVKKIILS